ncbi:hypothetical protein LLG88_12140 [bacterium]|nr:hypothetical protein [bacterium]
MRRRCRCGARRPSYRSAVFGGRARLYCIEGGRVSELSRRARGGRF